MSGGSMNYLYSKLEWGANFDTDTPERKAFMAHLVKVAKALHDIEWVDSGDYGPGDENEAIRACIGNGAAPSVEPVLDNIEQYRMQMTGICTAALGYWKEGEAIYPDYDTPALREVARLYAKYRDLHDAASPAHSAEPVAWRYKPMIGSPWSMSDDGYYISCKRDAGYIIEALAVVQPAPSAESVVTDDMRYRAARSLADRSADVCNVDREDNWKVYGDQFLADADAALRAALGEGNE